MEAKRTASLVVNPGLNFIGLFRFGQNIRSADCSEQIDLSLVQSVILTPARRI
jgi:hypothetical protein